MKRIALVAALTLAVIGAFDIIGISFLSAPPAVAEACTGNCK
jgi:hypothetical protein